VPELLSHDDEARILDAASRAARRFPWYAEMLRERGFFDGPELAAVPILRDEDLESTYYASTDAPNANEQTFLTSGTATGVRKRVRWSTRDHERYVKQRADLFRSFIGDDCRTACSDLGTGHAAASAGEIFAALALKATDIDVGWPVQRHVECLRESQPDILYTMPMILERVVANGGPGYAPRWVFVLGDLAPAGWRAAMETRLGMAGNHIVDLFGSIEVGAIAYSDAVARTYLFHDHVVPEAIAPDRERDDAGQALVLTSTSRDAFPAVRYASGDIVSGLATVADRGKRQWTYEKHLGREGAELKHGEMLSLHAMADAIGSVAPGVAWAVRRDGLEAVIELDRGAYTEAVARSVSRAVRAAHPAVDRMITSGLVGALRVEPRDFGPGTAKRSVR
jgi:phenylacetate-coenzyme A ligase PaaK-like adenylate-forming protein